MAEKPRPQPYSEVTRATLDKSWTLRTEGRLKDAKKSLEKLPDSDQLSPETVDLKTEMGIIYRMQNNYSEAKRYMLRAFIMARDLEDPERQLEALVGMMDINRTNPKNEGQLGNSFLQRDKEDAMDLAHRLPNSLTRARAYTEIALWDFHEKNYEDAFGNLTRADNIINLLQSSGNQDKLRLLQALSRVWNIRGHVYEAKGDKGHAYHQQELAYNGYSDVQDQRGMGNTLMAKGNLRAKHAETQYLARSLYKEALKVAQKGDGDQNILNLATEALARLDAS